MEARGVSEQIHVWESNLAAIEANLPAETKMDRVKDFFRGIAEFFGAKVERPPEQQVRDLLPQVRAELAKLAENPTIEVAREVGRQFKGLGSALGRLEPKAWAAGVEKHKGGIARTEADLIIGILKSDVETGQKTFKLDEALPMLLLATMEQEIDPLSTWLQELVQDLGEKVPKYLESVQGDKEKSVVALKSTEILGAIASTHVAGSEAAHGAILAKLSEGGVTPPESKDLPTLEQARAAGQQLRSVLESAVKTGKEVTIDQLDPQTQRVISFTGHKVETLVSQLNDAILGPEKRVETERTLDEQSAYRSSHLISEWDEVPPHVSYERDATGLTAKAKYGNVLGVWGRADSIGHGRISSTGFASIVESAVKSGLLGENKELRSLLK